MKAIVRVYLYDDAGNRFFGEGPYRLLMGEKVIGGKSGGGSYLTPQAKEFLRKYESYRDACYEADAAIYRQVFSEQ